MYTISVYPDVPAELIECLEMVDGSKIHPTGIVAQLDALEAKAAQFLPFRRPDQTQGLLQRTVRQPVPGLVVERINKFYYGDISRMKLLMAKGFIQGWIRQNLPVRTR